MTAPPESMPCLPPMLYHYTTHAGACGIATNKCLWATSIRHLSDATEFTYAHDVIRQALEEAASGKPSNVVEAVEYLLKPLDFSNMENSLDSMGTIGATYVLSLSREPDRLSQWRTYCPDGGYAFGFATAALLAIASDPHFELVECVYDKAQHLSEARSLAQSVLGQVEEALQGVRGSLPALPGRGRVEPHYTQLDFASIRRSMVEEIQLRAPAWKHHSFREEAEWRLVSARGLDPKRAVKFRAGRTAIVPYVEIEFKEPKAETHFANGLISALAHVKIGPCPEKEIALGSITHLLGVNHFSCQGFSFSETPYRHW